MKLVEPDVVTPLEKMSLVAFESAGEAIIVTDLSGTIQYINPAFEKISGYRREEVLGQNPRILKSGVHPPSFYERLWETISAGKNWKGMFLNRRKDGAVYQSEQTIAPMRDWSGRQIGYISIHEDVSERVRTEEQLHASELRTVRDAADERVRLARHELELARDVQSHLFPQAPISLPGIDIAGAVFSAEETCGDYYDFIPMPNGKLGVALGDVSGHGLGPALVMAETRAYLRALSQNFDDVGDILRRINEFLVGDLESGRFVSLFFAVLDPLSRSIVYSSAGQPAYHLDAKGHVTRLDNSGMVLGLLRDAEIPAGQRIELRPGDLVFAATDGLHETHTANGAMLGAEETLRILRTNRHRDSQAIIEELHGSACRFREGVPQQDDITMVVIKVPNS